MVFGFGKKRDVIDLSARYKKIASQESATQSSSEYADLTKPVSIQEVIITRILRRGNGKTTPIRIITEVWTKEGDKIAELDPCPEFALEKEKN
jgi:hypothetical protein